MYTIVPGSIPSDGAPSSSLGLPPHTVPFAFTGPFAVTSRILPRCSSPAGPPPQRCVFMALFAPSKGSPFVQSLRPDSLRPLPAQACPPPAPSPAAASPSARWAPGTGRSPPSWCRRTSGPGAGRGQGRQQDSVGRRPQEPGGWCRLGRPGRVGRAGGRADRRVGVGREVRWQAKARVAR